MGAKFYSPRQAAERWGCSHEAVRQWILEGHIEGARRVGSRWKIPESTVLRVEQSGLHLPWRKTEGENHE